MSAVADISSSARPFTVVLTGGIASGKSIVSKKFEELGIPVIDTDLISRKVIEPGKKTLTRIISEFGVYYLTPEGTLDRSKIRKLIFSDMEARRKLESIIHPAIAIEVAHQLEDLHSPYCLLVIPLFAESPNYNWVDRVLLVDVPEEIQIKRVIERDRIEREQAKAILEAQSSREDRINLADDVILNDQSLDALNEQILNLHLKYLELSGNI